MQGPYPASLSSLLQATGTALKRQAILQQLTLKLTPIMEKAMVDAVVVHRCSLHITPQGCQRCAEIRVPGRCETAMVAAVVDHSLHAAAHASQVCGRISWLQLTCDSSLATVPSRGLNCA